MNLTLILEHAKATVRPMLFLLGIGSVIMTSYQANPAWYEHILVGCIVASTVVLALQASRTEGWSTLLWSVVGLSFLLSSVVDVDDATGASLKIVDTPAVVASILWLMAALSISPAVLNPAIALRSRLALIAGLTIQGTEILLGLVGAQGGPPPWALSEELEIAYRAIFLAGLVSIAMGSTEMGPKVSRAWTQWVSSLSIAKTELFFRLWRLLRPRAPFSQYYASRISAKLTRGIAHRTLGPLGWQRSKTTRGNASPRRNFAAEGRHFFSELQVPELNPGSYVVDYGCGSLRIGQHFMAALEPGHYWGIDVVEQFYEDGRSLIGKARIAAYRPELHVIQPQLLRKIAQLKPSLIFSIAVMKHVPENELRNYWENLLSLLSSGGRIVVHFDRGTANYRTATMNWAYEIGYVVRLILSILPAARIAISDIGTPHIGSTHAFVRCRLDITLD